MIYTFLFNQSHNGKHRWCFYSTRSNWLYILYSVYYVNVYMCIRFTFECICAYDLTTRRLRSRVSIPSPPKRDDKGEHCVFMGRCLYSLFVKVKPVVCESACNCTEPNRRRRRHAQCALSHALDSVHVCVRLCAFTCAENAVCNVSISIAYIHTCMM